MKLEFKKALSLLICALLLLSVCACGGNKKQPVKPLPAESADLGEIKPEVNDTAEESSVVSESENSEEISNESVEEEKEVLASGDFGYIVTDSVVQLCAYYGTAEEITVPEEIEGYTVTAIAENAFSNNGTVKVVNVGNSVINVSSGAFSGCGSLSEVNIGNSVALINANCFDNCPALTKINVDAANSYYLSVDGVLYTDDKSCLIRCPQGYIAEEYVVPDATLLIGEGAFKKCAGIDSVVLPEVCELSASAFFHCGNLKTVSLGSAVVAIPDYCFFGCVLLEELHLEEGVETLGEYAFFGCVGLKKLSLPSTLVSIADTAFECCTGIEEVEALGDCASAWYENYQQQ